MTISMKLAVLAIAAAAGVAAASPANAEVQYPWCALYSAANGGTNCGFVSYQQCLETIRGMGGTCNQNPAYPPPRERQRRK